MSSPVEGIRARNALDDVKGILKPEAKQNDKKKLGKKSKVIDTMREKYNSHPHRRVCNKVRKGGSPLLHLAAASQPAQERLERKSAQSEHNLFKIHRHPKQPFVTCQLPAESPPGPLGWASSGGAQPARPRSHPGAATPSLWSWRWKLSLSQLLTA